jgi:hypothetical protein
MLRTAVSGLIRGDFGAHYHASLLEVSGFRLALTRNITSALSSMTAPRRTLLLRTATIQDGQAFP